jgi:hypothetical protein
MSIDPKDYLPRVNDWYCGSGVYSGMGTLCVAGVVKASGPAEVSWTDLGETTITMDLPPNELALAHALFEEDEISFRLQAAEGGLFTADRAFAHHNQIQVGAEGVSARIRLTAAKSTFDTGPANIPSYWVIPAVNFVADLSFSSAALSKHPLRIYSAPDIPEELEQKDAFGAKMVATQKERLIPFSFGGKPAFIERLPDYDAKLQSLTEKSADHHATAVIVGAIPTGADTDLAGLFSWLPTDIFYALAVATGTYVGSGFVEFRTADNKLAKRIHISSRCPAYREGHRFIEDPICVPGHSAYAELIERVVGTFPTKNYLRSVANQVVAGSQHDLVEDATDAYVRSLEALTKPAGLSRQDLLAGVPAPVVAKIHRILDSAAADIKAEATIAQSNGDTVTFDRLTRISARARSMAQTESSFGLAVTMLLAAKGLHDETVVNAYLATKNPPTSWAQFLSKTRGAVIHEGMIHLPTREELLEVHSLLRHLGDVILRLFALEIGYTGKYLPTVARWAREARDLDWVNSSTTPADLRLV